MPYRLRIMAAALGVGIAAGTLPADAAAQARPAEPRTYRFVSEVDDAGSLWVNPAGLGVRPGTGMLSVLSADLGGDVGGPEVRQALLGIRLRGLGLGYRHDRFGEAERLVRRRGDSYAVGLGIGGRAGSVGLARSWYRVGPRASAWDLGALLRPAPWASLGVAWRDLGSPEVGGVTLAEHVAAGVSVRPFRRPLTASLETVWPTDGGGVDAYRVGLRLLTRAGIEAFASADFDDDLGLDVWRLGLRLRGRGSSTDVLAGPANVDGAARATLGRLRFSGENAPPRLAPGRLVRLDVGGVFVDYPPPGFALFGPRPPALQPVLAALRQAREAPDVRGLLLRVRPLGGAFLGPVSALHQELWAELDAFRRAGKPVVAFLDSRAGPSELYVASAASEIVAPRLASVAVLGVNLELQRLRRTLERFHVEWDTLAAGAHKTAFQTLFTDTATAEQAAWIDALVERAYSELVAGIAAGRSLAEDSVRALVDRGLLGPARARESGLIDAVGDLDAARDRLRELARARHVDRLRLVRYREERWGTPPTVAVVHAWGPIVTGRGGRDPLWGGVSMGSETVSRQLRAAAALPGVRAVVLRVDSPGGSAVASDEILRAVERVRTERRLPVIVSMGNLAASGGYWISMKADTIVADPLTVTGSIGVISAIPVLEQLMDTLRVVNEQWTRGRYADLYTVTRHRSPEELALLRARIMEIYDVFIQEVAEGRGLPPDSALALAGGRVWFGRDAREVGLVDELGGLHHALQVAAARGGIDEPYRVVLVRDPPRRFPLRLLGILDMDGFPAPFTPTTLP